MNIFQRIAQWFKRHSSTQASEQPSAPVEVVKEPAKPERAHPGVRGLKLLRYPAAIQDKYGKMKTQGKYAGGYPQGAVVHFTAGSSAESSLTWGMGEGYCFFVIAKDGTIFQNFDLDSWGYHAGASSWKGLPGSVSDELVGIEIDCAGSLDKIAEGKFQSWFGKVFGSDSVRHSSGEDNIKPGYYVKYTPEQEEALISLLLWMKENNPEVFDLNFVVGHDEVAPNRKNDPGAALSMSMPKFRQLLQRKWQERN